MTRHRIDPTPAVLHDTFSREHDPVSTVDPGDELVVRTLDCWGQLERQTFPGEVKPHAFPTFRGHCLVGPIEVRGARTGQVLAVTLHDLRTDGWGFTIAGGRETPINVHVGVDQEPLTWLLWDADDDAGTAVEQHGLQVGVAPFLGVIGIAPPEPGEHSTIPPRPVGGGNIDCKELVAGSTLFLPIAVDGALLYLGDGHAAQGDGEVGGTAIECGMTTTLTVDLVDDAPLDTVHAVTPTSRITFGFSADLNTASGDALAAMVTWMQALYGLDRPTTLALASTCVDLRVTQVVNQTWGVHAVLDRSALTSLG